MMLEQTYAVLGVPVAVRSENPEVSRIAALAFGGPVAREHQPACRVWVRVVDGPPSESFEVAHEVDRERRLMVRAGASRGWSDARAGSAEIAVTPATLGRPDFFRYNLLESVTLWMVTHRDRCPLHAAALEEGGRALLLTGRSGAGKSTLTYAAFREGLQVLSEDTVYVQTRPVVRVWGLPGFLHLTPESTRFFPELASAVAAQRANGKTKVAVDLHRPGEPPPACADRVGICVIRQGPVMQLERLSPRRAAEEVASHTEGGFGYWPDDLGPAVERIGATGGWTLTVPPDPSAAVPALREMLAAL